MIHSKFALRLAKIVFCCVLSVLASYQLTCQTIMQFCICSVSTLGLQKVYKPNIDVLLQYKEELQRQM